MTTLSQLETWPTFPLEAWSGTYTTLHLWTQIVGKISLAQTTEFWEKSEKLKTSFMCLGIPYRYTHEDIDFLNSKFEELSKMINQFHGELIQV